MNEKFNGPKDAIGNLRKSLCTEVFYESSLGRGQGAPNPYCIFCPSSALYVTSLHPTATSGGNTLTVFSLQLRKQTKRFKSGRSSLSWKVTETKCGKELKVDLKKTKRYMSYLFGFVDEDAELL